MSFRHRRQIVPSGAVTFSAPSIGTSNSLAVDTSNTGTPSGLLPPTITVSSTAAPSTSTETASSTSGPTTSASSSTTKFNTGALVGLIVGVFAILAIALVVFMTIRHKKKLQSGRLRAKSIARKSWSRLKDDQKPADLQMRATSHAKTASIADDARAGEAQPLSPSLQSSYAHHTTALSSRSPFLAQASSESVRTAGQATPPPSRATDESHIPNPFASPAHSPSHSPSPSHTSTHSSQAYSSGFAALSSLSQHTPQYQHASIITASSASEYPLEFPTPPDQPSYTIKPAEDEASPVSPTTPRLSRKQSAKAAAESRSRELKAMQDLISALDERAQSKKPPPPAFNLKVDTDSSNGMSRLSMGEGLVTPGGHSIREEDTVLMYDDDGNPYWAHRPPSSFDQQNFPLPPAQVFRAALSPDEPQRKAGKKKGKASDPFQG